MSVFGKDEAAIAKFAEGMPFKEVIISGSMERLNAILMTAFTSALGLAPLVVEGGPGKEICNSKIY